MRRRLISLLATVVAVASMGLATAMPVGASDRFTDVPDSNIFHGDIGWLANDGITRGCNPPVNDEFCPGDFVTRGQMAAFFVRGLGLTSTEGGTEFTDTDDTVFTGDILRLSAADITRGCNPPANDQFCPHDNVTRGQMAAFFVRALGLTSTEGGSDFVDTQDSIFVNDILRLSASDITRGCNPPANDEFCPDDFVTREQMAAFFHRASRVEVEIQVIQYSDWHGQLDPLSVFGEGDFGGAAQLATYFAQERAANPNTVIITGGDDFGGSPPLASIFDEVPAILAQNLMGLDVSALGNHNFDGGIDHLQEMIDLAEYDYVAANLAKIDDNLTSVEPYQLYHLSGAKIAVIGVTNEEAPTLVFPGSFGTIEVTDSVAAAQSLRDSLADTGVDVFILVAHKGVRSLVNGEPQGELIDLAEDVEGFDLVLGDHTDFLYEGIHNGALVTEARSKGRDYARISLTVRPLGGAGVVAKSVEFVEPVADAVTPDPAVEAMLAPFREMLAAEFDVRIGVAENFFPHGGGYEREGEAEVGNLMTDAFLAFYETDLAFTNSGGIRSPLPSDYVPADPSLDRDGAFPDDLVLGDVFQFHSFGNTVVTREVSGELLHEMMEHGLSDLPNPNGRFPQIAGFEVIYNSIAAPGSRVVTIQFPDGTPIPADSTMYTIALPDFVNAGGDAYTMLADGLGTTREPLTTVVEAYIRDQGSVAPFLDCRLVDLDATSEGGMRQTCP